MYIAFARGFAASVEREVLIKSFACNVTPFLSNVSCGMQSKSALYSSTPSKCAGTVALVSSIASNNPLNDRGIIPGFKVSPKTVCVSSTLGRKVGDTFPDPVTPIVNNKESFPWISRSISGDEVLLKTSLNNASSLKMCENWNFSHGFGRRRVLGIYHPLEGGRVKGKGTSGGVA